MTALRVLAFCSGQERYLVRLEAVRAVVRLRGLRRLPGSSGALIGVLDVQEAPVAIYDTRPTPAAADPVEDRNAGDVMVLAAGWPQHAVGVACDRVEGLLELTELPEAPAHRPPSLPSYVEALLRVDDALLPLVDVIGLAEAGGTY